MLIGDIGYRDRKTTLTPAFHNSLWELRNPVQWNDYESCVAEFNQLLQDKLRTDLGNNSDEWPQEVQQMTPITTTNFAGFILRDKASTLFGTPNSDDWVTIEAVRSIIYPQCMALRINYSKDYGTSTTYGENEHMPQWEPTTQKLSNLKASLVDVSFAGYLFGTTHFLLYQTYSNKFDKQDWQHKMKNDGWYSYRGRSLKKECLAKKKKYQFVVWDARVKCVNLHFLDICVST